MEQQKTIEQWYDDDLPEPLRSKALKYIYHKPRFNDPSTPVSSLYDALMVGFDFSHTPEGHTYWYEIAKRLPKSLESFKKTPRKPIEELPTPFIEW